MDKWDQKKLEEVVQSKSGKQPPTDIVCKYFLEAIETSKYGWFWECPNGGSSCKYRHALPPGFVLKSKSKAEEKEEISLEEFLESEVSKKEVLSVQHIHYCLIASQIGTQPYTCYS